MKKYKLIKEYPGSPELGYIWEMYDNYKGDYHKQPEFWGEVIEKDYEILSLKYNNTDYAFKKGDNYYSDNSCTGGYVYLNDLNNEDIRYRAIIHSVKRLSDGEIFTISDKVQHCEWKGIIHEIVLHPITNTNRSNCFIYINVGDRILSYLVNVIQKAKQPLFTTEDGVDIYQNTDFYYVNEALNFKICEANSNGKWYFQKCHKLFLTKEAAEEYILMNKPCLSINDVMNQYERHSDWKTKEFKEELKKLINGRGI